MTKHYKDINNDILGFEADDVIPDGLTEITMAEIPAIIAAKLPKKTAAEITLEEYNRRVTMREKMADDLGVTVAKIDAVFGGL